MLITFEGIEGSGKSTQANLLNEFLSGKGYKVTVTREPGWGHLGNLIRTIILDERELVLTPMAELFLFCADRAQHVKDFIEPRLKNGEIVICDRFYDSTIVYQGYGRKLDMRLVNKAAKASALDVTPDTHVPFEPAGKGGVNETQGEGVHHEDGRGAPRIPRAYQAGLYPHRAEGARKDKEHKCG